LISQYSNINPAQVQKWGFAFEKTADLDLDLVEKPQPALILKSAAPSPIDVISISRDDGGIDVPGQGSESEVVPSA
jgi:hypothetical protein